MAEPVCPLRIVQWGQTTSGTSILRPSAACWNVTGTPISGTSNSSREVASKECREGSGANSIFHRAEKECSLGLQAEEGQVEDRGGGLPSARRDVVVEFEVPVGEVGRDIDGEGLTRVRKSGQGHHVAAGGVVDLGDDESRPSADNGEIVHLVGTAAHEIE